MVRAYIELPRSGSGSPVSWAQKQLAMTALQGDGYHVEEIRRVSSVWLWLTGSRVEGIPALPAERPSGSREPALEPALPSDAVPGSVIDADADVEIRLRDGSWTAARVLVQRQDRYGRWCVGLHWEAGGVGRDGMFVHDPAHIRRAGLEKQRGEQFRDNGRFADRVGQPLPSASPVLLCGFVAPLVRGALVRGVIAAVFG